MYITYNDVSMETWELIKKIITKFQTTQRTMERKMLSNSLRYHILNTETRRRSWVTDEIVTVKGFDLIL